MVKIESGRVLKQAFAVSFVVAAVVFLAGFVYSNPSVVSFEINTSSSGTSQTYGDIIHSSSVMLEIKTDKVTECRYSDSPAGFSSMTIFDYNLGDVHKKIFTDLSDGMYTKYVRCKDSSGAESDQFKVMYRVSPPISAEILLSKSSPVNSGRVEVEVTTSKMPLETPTLTYSSDGVSYNPVSLFGEGKVWTGYLIVPKTAGHAVGSFKFSGKDLEGISGNKITKGEVFLVDTVAPETIVNIRAVGHDGMVRLEWDSEEDAERYKIYRSTSPNVREVDFYKEITEETDSYSDTSVERGKTYYYKIAGVDEAGNEAELSVEVYATALLSDSSLAAKGLSPELIGLVDSSLASVDSAIDVVDEIEREWGRKDGREKIIYDELKLEGEISAARSELESLRREVELYKSQSITRSELEKKLNSADVRVNTARRKVPESVSIASERESAREMKVEDIEKIILKLKPGLSRGEVEDLVESSASIGEDGSLSVKGNLYNIDLTYMDGTRKSLALVVEGIESDIEKIDEVYLMALFPSGAIEGASSLDIFNLNYNLADEEGIISFDADTKKISYSTARHIAVESFADFALVPVDLRVEEESTGITGYSVFNFIDAGRIPPGVFIGMFVLIILGGYFVFIKFKGRKEMMAIVHNEVSEAENRLTEGDIHGASEVYKKLSKSYSALGWGKSKIHEKIEDLCHKIHFHHCKNHLESSGGAELPSELRKVYDSLPERYKKDLFGGGQ